MNDMIANVVEWARLKGILDNGTREGQAWKTIEEANELLKAVQEDNQAEVIDAIGDVFVTIIIQAHMNGLKVEDCLRTAYGVIAKRSGRMEGGVFVKD